MIYLKAKSLFLAKKYTDLVKMAKINQLNQGMVSMFLNNVITYVKYSDIEYRSDDSDQAKRLLLIVDKIKFGEDGQIVEAPIKDQKQKRVKKE